MQCNILIFDYEKVVNEVAVIKYLTSDNQTYGPGKGRKHPIYVFYNENDEYICEVRYGGATANALQRGFWTNTKRAKQYFKSATNGWIEYEHNLELIRLLRLALNSTQIGHKKTNETLQQDIDRIKHDGQIK